MCGLNRGGVVRRSGREEAKAWVHGRAMACIARRGHGHGIDSEGLGMLVVSFVAAIVADAGAGVSVIAGPGVGGWRPAQTSEMMCRSIGDIATEVAGRDWNAQHHHQQHQLWVWVWVWVDHKRTDCICSAMWRLLWRAGE